MDESRIRKCVLALAKEHKSILKKVLHPKPMLAGGLVERWLKCGKANCHCRDGKLHGPYYYLSVLEKGRPRTIYLGYDDKFEVKLLRRYQEFQRSIARLNLLNRRTIELLWTLGEDKIKVFNMKRGNRL